MALSVAGGQATPTNSARTFAEGMAVRVTDPVALEIIMKGAERIVEVNDDEVAEAVRAYYTDTHNLAEGAGAASLAALMQERDQMSDKKVGVILTGGNIDQSWYKTILAGYVPVV